MALEPAAPRGGWLGGLRRTGRALGALPARLGWLVVLGWMALIWALSSSEFPPPTGDPGAWAVIANLGHAPLFGLLALFLAAVIVRPGAPGTLARITPADALRVLLLVGLYGLLDEWHQSLTPGREPSGFDLLTDVVGASCVLWIAAYLARAPAREGGLYLRLLAGVLLCTASAALATAF